MAGWDYPISREALLLADLFDLEHFVNSDPKKRRPRPHAMRPFKVGVERQRMGNTGGRTPAQVISILDRARAGRAG